jgi:uncharacterized SAM-binding protein YcdF (DUF218 family)
MLFVLAKLLTIFVTPSDISVLALVGAAVALEGGRVRLSRNILIGVAAFFLLFGFGPLGNWLARPIEDRFGQPPAGMPPPDCIIELGGAIDAGISHARNSVVFDESGARLTETAIEARRYPNAHIVLSGGSGSLIFPKFDEATVARRLLIALGVDASRITIETRSRTTYENALLSRPLVKTGETCLLVTSALHMPRAVGVFRHLGYAIVPDPAGYLTSGRPTDFWRVKDMLGGLERTDAAFHEWIGLFVYRLAGRTDSILPGRQ